MKRQIIKIDEDLCIGCGICANTCEESAIEIVDGKAKLIREDFCDGFGNCLGECPTGAISFIEKEAPAYDEKAVAKHKEELGLVNRGCPGSRQMNLETNSSLNQWPVQIKLAPASAPFFNGAKLLIAADCTAFAYGNFHRDFLKDNICIIGCPKLDMVDYTEKLREIMENDIKSVEVLRMEVPCCTGIERATINAIEASGKDINCKITTISVDGKIKQ